jgi:hypothetical protein
MERDDQRGSVGRTSVARQPLFPRETPMRALCSGQDVLSEKGDRRWRQGGTAGQANRFAADHLEPFPPDATAWPVPPHHGSKRERFGCIFTSGRGIREGRFQRPKHRTHPPRLDRGAAFLTLRPQGTAATMADASGIQNPHGAITIRTPFLGIQRAIGGTA